MAPTGVSIRQISEGLMTHEKCQKCRNRMHPKSTKTSPGFPHKEGFTPIEFPFLSIQTSLFHGEMPCLPVVVAWHESLTPQLPGWKQRDLSLWRIPRSPRRRAKRPVTSAFHWRQRYREMRKWKMQIVCDLFVCILILWFVKGDMNGKLCKEICSLPARIIATLEFGFPQS